jgi:poly(beta-D-mannuronate) lyase
VDLRRELASAGPGDTIVVADGVHSTKTALVVEGRRGRPEAPVTISAEHRGKAEIAGAAGWILRDCEHVVLEGFTMTHAADRPSVLLENCRNVRITRNVFRLRERARPGHMEHWVYAIGARSASNRIDRNRFERKVNAGSPVFVRGDDATLTCSQHDWIERNHFLDVVYANGSNGHETVRTGGNDLGASGRSSFALIESNLLERCSGEDEILSIKSSDNVIRGNTLIDCRGAICLRLGNRNEVSGNLVVNENGMPGCGGVKLYGFDHRVTGNRFEGLTGRRHEAPLALVPGMMEAESTDWIGKRYRDNTAAPPVRAWIAHNVWIDCVALQFGFAPESSRPFTPLNCRFVSNLVVRTRPIAAPLANLEPVRGLEAYGNRADPPPAATDAWAAWFRAADLAAKQTERPIRPSAGDVGPDSP